MAPKDNKIDGNNDEGSNGGSGKGTAVMAAMASPPFVSLSLFVTYLAVMGAKCALPATLPILSSPSPRWGLPLPASSSLSRQEMIARLVTLSTLAISAGKLALGPLIDRAGGVASLQTALAALAACLLLVGSPRACPSLSALCGYWVLVDFAFSSCWASCVKCVRDVWRDDEQSWPRQLGRLAMAARLGNALSFALFACLLQNSTTLPTTVPTAVPTTAPAPVAVDATWRRVFRVSGFIQLVPLLMLTAYRAMAGTNRTNRATAAHDPNTPPKPTKPTLSQSLQILQRQSKTIEFWLHLLSRSLLMILVSFLLFLPTYMSHCYQMSSSTASRVGSLFALGCFTSVSIFGHRWYAANPPQNINVNIDVIANKETNYNRDKAWLMLRLMAVSCLCLSFQYCILLPRPPLSFISMSTATATTAIQIIGSLIMFLWGFSLAIPFYLPSSIFALRRGGDIGSATIVDIFDVCGFGLLTVFNRYVSKSALHTHAEGIVGGKGLHDAMALLMQKRQAWIPVISWMLGASFVTMLSLFGAVWLEGARNKDQTKANE